MDLVEPIGLTMQPQIIAAPMRARTGPPASDAHKVDWMAAFGGNEQPAWVVSP